MAAGGTSRWARGEEPKATIVLKLAVFLVVVVVSLYNPVRQWLGWRAAQHYVAIAAHVRTLEMEAYPYKGHLQYRYHVEYEYGVGGRSYRSKSMFLVDGLPSEQVHGCLYEALRQAREAQAPVIAWVDPEKPANAVLDREMYEDPALFIFAGIGMAASLFVAAYYFLPRKLKPSPKTVRRLNRSW